MYQNHIDSDIIRNSIHNINKYIDSKHTIYYLIKKTNTTN